MGGDETKGLGVAPSPRSSSNKNGFVAFFIDFYFSSTAIYERLIFPHPSSQLTERTLSIFQRPIESTVRYLLCGMLCRQLRRSASELFEFLEFPSGDRAHAE